ncbi:polysaccharide pyruvyl transferase family protein [Mucilaginibacter robiniae]|uniref:Polysaccharide pyruvyl transferase family protein n=1 Tax=Mucilaginibacter robiniae TaxID=2728022 RepID=A0A7L5E8X0_9SPHI|nr:polysaccharide pyruvyl transferase family protein [Mucilaginibacter robiniae]QJD96826.1 polysaccharide pyruvyl transferase family protein [Mucilaginibacter robiniae]
MKDTDTRGLKIGVLTFHRCINYGSYWQARGLVEGLQSRGHEVVLLDHYSRRVNFAEWKCALQPVLPTHVPKSDHAIYRKKMEKFFSLFETLPLSPAFELDDPSQMEEYDVVVVGSDEVWNLSHPWYGYCPLFYGDGIKAKHLISYAASFGNYDATWGLNPDWAKKLLNFESISVRDENSRTIIKNALGFEPEMVLDPCLQFAIHPDERDLSHLPKPYVALYGHNFTEFFIREIRAWANQRNLPLVSIGYRNDWADENWLTADPHDFANFMAKSEAVVTNFFHGCVFALINSKPFVCETTPYRSNKLIGLMTKVGGEKHLITEGTPAEIYHARLSEPVDEKIQQKIAELRQSSNAYLDAALAPKPMQLS